MKKLITTVITVALMAVAGIGLAKADGLGLGVDMGNGVSIQTPVGNIQQKILGGFHF